MSDLNRLANKKETQFIHMCDSEVPIDNFLPRVKAKNIVIYIYISTQRNPVNDPPITNQLNSQ